MCKVESERSQDGVKRQIEWGWLKSYEQGDAIGKSSHVGKFIFSVSVLRKRKRNLILAKLITLVQLGCSNTYFSAARSGIFYHNVRTITCN
jgi:hypothetical protein